MDDLDEIKPDALDIEELDKLIETTKASKFTVNAEQDRTIREEPLQKIAEAKDVKRLEVIDDFIRNFLIRNKMNRTLVTFQQ